MAANPVVAFGVRARPAHSVAGWAGARPGCGFRIRCRVSATREMLGRWSQGCSFGFDLGEAPTARHNTATRYLSRAARVRARVTPVVSV